LVEIFPGQGCPPPDDGKIITVDSGFTIAQAFAVSGDEYVARAMVLTLVPLASRP
jgi:hypothetical protein